MRGSVLERFEARIYKVPDAPGCWLWTGRVVSSPGSKEYGLFDVSRGVTWLADRLAWALYRGAIPEGMNVLHRCDLPCCVNPEHLWIGTQKQNLDDMYSKGRGKNRVVITTEDRRLIREARNAGVSMRAIAAAFGVSHAVVRNQKKPPSRDLVRAWRARKRAQLNGLTEQSAQV